MQPPRILGFIFSVLAALFLISLFFPGEGIRINDHITLQFPTAREIIHGDTNQYADISGLLSRSHAISDSVYLAMLESDPAETGVSFAWDTVRADESSLKAFTHPLEYPDGKQDCLYPFFRQMRKLERSGGKLRVMHYGDSQIEGDRITSYVRYKLQERLGGNGIGLQPLVQLYGYQISLRHTASSNWERYTAFGKVDSNLLHNQYGALGVFTRFSPYPDSLPENAGMYEAWVNIEPSLRSFRITRAFTRCKLFYGNATEPVMVEVYLNDSLYDADFLEVTEDMMVRTWDFDVTPGIMRLVFKSDCSPDFYGISLEGNGGLNMDNVPMRGSSGLVFTKIDPDLLAEFYELLGVRLLILQFGGNVVPYISDNIGYYQNWFSRELQMLKSTFPDISIIVVGVADMSLREKDRFVTYPSVEKVRDALKTAAFESGCAFWDMYEAMGGYNSMPSWVFAQPPLATSDFVHFNERGARVLAEMFYNALIHDYREYLESSH